MNSSAFSAILFQTQCGARVYVAINVSFNSDERLQDFNRGNRGSLEGKFNGFTKKFCDSCGVEKIFKIPAFDFSASFYSGDASRLGQIFGSGGDVTLASCSLDALVNCDAVFNKVLAYLAQEEFAEGVGQSRRLERLEVRLVNCPEWNIFYRSHVQNIGWQNWVRNGQLSGTTGQSLRMEAIEIKIER